uniref:Vacuolar-sorting protein SNF8 n=1 Tax=Chaetoceros debilis TaxID=122233 RepID=A0A7S3VB31_9STRA
MAHRRGRAGIGRMNAGAGAKLKYTKKAEEIKEVSLQSAVSTVKQLEVKLTEFAKTHHKAIQQDPAFRHKFLSMCAPLGVDPLTSKKSFWSFLNMGDFYHELAVKVAEVCYAYKSKNGGIMALKEVRRVLNIRGRTKFKLNANAKDEKQRKTTSTSTSTSGGSPSPGKYSEDDIIVAIGKLSKLGSGFRTVMVGSTRMVLSVPTELDNDHVQVIQCAQTVFAERREGISFDQVREMTQTQTQTQTQQWSDDRVKRALDLLLAEGMAWLDRFNGHEYYWFPSVWKEGMSEDTQ